MSQASNQDKNSEIMDVTPEEVVNQMNLYGVKTLIHGHTHRPAKHALKTQQGASIRYVLGDWEKEFWYIKADNKETSLVKQTI